MVRFQNYTLAVFLWVWFPLGTTTTASNQDPLTSSRLGPIPILPSYRWSAAVDRNLGTASSLEISHPSNPQLEIGTARAAVFHRMETYGTWLCRGTVSFGLLQAVHQAGSVCEVRTRWMGIVLLSLGRPRRWERRAYHLPWSVLPNENVCTVTIPISGGCLAIVGNKSNGGALVFTLRTTFPGKDEDTTRHTFVTEIQHYRPMLCGYSIPIHPLRARLYLGTQSLAHVFVMWRFHKHIADSVC
jgi:hypothetical protein